MVFGRYVRFFAVLFCFSLLPVLAISQELYINEVVASNGAGLEDEDGDNEDWLEIYNAGESPVDLEGFGLADDTGTPMEWTFPSLSLGAGEYLVVFASDKDRIDPAGELHTSFQIDQDGEPLLHTDPEGNTVDELPPTEIPTDISFGRQPDGSTNWYFFDHPTPGSPNESEGFREILDPPTFSENSGFYATGFQLELNNQQAGTQLRYTMDGSVPDSSSAIYRTPITIQDRTEEPNYLSNIRTTPKEADDKGYRWYQPKHKVFKGTVVRARVFNEGGQTFEHNYKILFRNPVRRRPVSLAGGFGGNGFRTSVWV